MPEIYYKYVLALLLFLSAIIRGTYDLKYRRAEKVSAYHEGRERFFVVGVGIFLTAPALIYIFFPILDFASFPLAGKWRIAGAVTMFLNLVFFLWVHISLGNNWSPIIELNREHKLVTSGPYKYIRHPMYASIFVHCFSLWILSANHVVGLSALLSFSIIYPFRVNAEEQMMLDRFGEEYKAYIKRTGRLLPKWFQLT